MNLVVITTLSKSQLIAGVNALHEAEEQKLPLTARVQAVASALLPMCLTDCGKDTLISAIADVTDRLERRLSRAESLEDAEEDRAAINAMRQLLSKVTPSPCHVVDERIS